MKLPRSCTAFLSLLAVISLFPHNAEARNKRKKTKAPKSIKRKHTTLTIEKEVLPSPADGWKTACELVPDLVAKVRPALLGNKKPSAATWKNIGARYQTVSHSSKTYGRIMSDFYFSKILKQTTMVDVGKTVEEIGERATDFRKVNRPLLAGAEKIELGLKAVWKELASSKAPAGFMERMTTSPWPGSGADELSFSLKSLSDAVNKGDAAASAKWAGEAYGAASRLADILRWVDLQTEWFEDLNKVFLLFKECLATSDVLIKKQPGASWQNFMFGRLPGAQSIQFGLYGEAPMVDHLLSDFYLVSEKDRAAMGSLAPKNSWFSICPERRGSFEKLLNAQDKNGQKTVRRLPMTKYELSAFNSNIWRYEDEGRIDNLIESVKLYFRNYKKSSVCELMEVIHICQGAGGASTSAEDRYHPEVIAFSARLKKKKPDEAAKLAHDLAYGFYTWDGKPHYQGRIWTLTDAFKKKAVDCIRVSQLIGCINANAGYAGIKPIRITRGNLAAGAVALSGHTFVNWEYKGRNLSMDGLAKSSFQKPYEAMHTGSNEVVSCALSYRGLNMYMAGEIYFPQGPIKMVYLRMPHYGFDRDGFDK